MTINEWWSNLCRMKLRPRTIKKAAFIGFEAGLAQHEPLILEVLKCCEGKALVEQQYLSVDLRNRLREAVGLPPLQLVASKSKWK